MKQTIRLVLQIMVTLMIIKTMVMAVVAVKRP